MNYRKGFEYMIEGIRSYLIVFDGVLVLIDGPRRLFSNIIHLGDLTKVKLLTLTSFGLRETENRL
jgi:hypothetical protein